MQMPRLDCQCPCTHPPTHPLHRTPTSAEQRCIDAGADIVKFATMANDISDAHRVLSVLRRAPVPTIALAMGERGQVARLLAPKYGGFLTFGALSQERASAPGQPSLRDLAQLYRLPSQGPATRLFGIVGNPVAHSRSPAIHNAAMSALGYNGVYVPLLVDDMPTFLSTFSEADWAGFSVTIPHKEAALQGAASVDPVAAAIGAVNTLVRQPDGSLRGYNTDWSAAIHAIERGLDPDAAPLSATAAAGSASSSSSNGGSGGGGGAAASPLAGKRVVVVGAGGAGRALAFGAAVRGASVTIANRNVQRAEELAAQLDPPARACGLEALACGAVVGDVLVNTTSVGMHPHVRVLSHRCCCCCCQCNFPLLPLLPLLPLPNRRGPCPRCRCPVQPPSPLAWPPSLPPSSPLTGGGDPRPCCCPAQ